MSIGTTNTLKALKDKMQALRDEVEEKKDTVDALTKGWDNEKCRLAEVGSLSSTVVCSVCRI